MLNLFLFIIDVENNSCFFTLLVTRPIAAEDARPLGEAKEVLRCPDVKGCQGDYQKLESSFIGGLFADHAR